MIKGVLKPAIISLHPLLERYWQWFQPVSAEPYICVITPVFDQGIGSLQKLIAALRQQKYGNFIHVAVANGEEPETQKLINKLRRQDKRFHYFAIDQEEIFDYQSLLQNLGRRRRLTLQKFKAVRYIFFDADFKLEDQSYFAKLRAADIFIRKDIYVTKIVHSGRVTTFPTDFDIANFTFTRRLADRQPYFTDLDAKFGRGNDFRYFVAINRPGNTAFLDIVSGSKDGNREYHRATDRFNQEANQDRLISVFGNRFDANDLTSMEGVLRSHLVGMGRRVAEFEKEFSRLIGFSHAVATNSCTNAFWLLFQALQLAKASEVIIPNIHFFGIRNVFELSGLQYRVVDVETGVPNISLESLKNNLTSKTKAIVFLEYGGYPLNVKSIKNYLTSIGRKDILLILDAANSPLTMVDGKYSATDYDFALYSFDMNKIIVTGDGGMILSNRGRIMDRLKDLSYCGVSGEKTGFGKSRQSGKWWETTVIGPGLKLAMNDLTASLGLAQLGHAPEFIAKRQEIINLYQEKLRSAVQEGWLTLPPVITGVENNVYLYWLLLSNQKTRDNLAQYLLRHKIYSTVKYEPLDPNAPTPHARDFYSRALCLPLNQNLEATDVDYIVDTVKRFFQQEI